MRYLGLASLLTFLSLPLITHADNKLTLDLPPSRTEAAPSTTQHDNPSYATASTPSSAPAGQAPRAGGPPLRHSSLRSNAAAYSKENVVGRLGVAAHIASIRASRSTRKPALAQVAAGTYLALNRDMGDWYGVLMADRSIGWIPKRDVKLLDFEVVAPAGASAQRPEYGAGGDSPVLNNGQKTILQVAYSFLGVPYRWGGASAGGMDCSAFVQRCFAALGIRLPRTAHEQILCGIPVQPDQLQPADRLYFASRDGRITHTGIYIGNDYFIHASSSRGGVAVSRLSEPLYRRMFAGARR